ncbi:MAG: hypothetical protein CL623_08655 [Arcobacter sp.]|nr:hypothetical protein [Arcobacter sp.]|tara:strand:+ start:6382 stop:7131 length:750 start_codon:yes stop_codon:yes gene_type:complete
MENKKSLLIIFTLIITVHIVVFANLEINEKVVVAQANSKPNVSKIKLKNIVIKKPEPKPQPVVKEVIKAPVEIIKPLVKTKSKNIIKHKKKKKKVVKKQRQKKTEIIKKVEKPIEKVEIIKKVEVAKTPVLEQESKKNIQKKVLLDSSQIKALENDYLSKLRYLIERNKIYPKSAKRLRQMGKVHISFIITKDGYIKNAKILRNSKYKRLNKAAIAILSNINKFEPIPKKLNKNSWEITVPIVYEITRS